MNNILLDIALFLTSVQIIYNFNILFEDKVIKNPSSSISASALIDSLIHKGKLSSTKFGGIYISKKHCNYFINDGTGTCLDLENLMSIIKKEIYSRNKINLESEICIY